jgi:hypothetical protein
VRCPGAGRQHLVGEEIVLAGQDRFHAGETGAMRFAVRRRGAILAMGRPLSGEVRVLTAANAPCPA